MCPFDPWTVVHACICFLHTGTPHKSHSRPGCTSPACSASQAVLTHQRRLQGAGRDLELLRQIRRHSRPECASPACCPQLAAPGSTSGYEEREVAAALCRNQDMRSTCPGCTSPALFPSHLRSPPLHCMLGPSSALHRQDGFANSAPLVARLPEWRI